MLNIWNKLTESIGKKEQKIELSKAEYNPETGIDELLYLPTKVLNALERNGIYTIRDLEKTGRDCLIVMKQIGIASLRYIDKAYEDFTGKRLPQTRTIDPEPIKENNKTNLSSSPIFTTEVIQEKKEYVSISPNNYATYDWLGEERYLKTSLNRDVYIDQLGLTQQIINALAKINITTINDILSVPTNKLWKAKGIGRKSIIKISMELINPSNPLLGKNVNNEDLVTFMLLRLKDSREKEIIVRRYGLKTGERQTLEEIGHDYKLTRERIRQIEARALKKLRHPTNTARNIIKKAVESVILKEGGIISDEQADKLLIPIIGNNNFDGSSLLDLVTDLGGIYTVKIGDVSLYSPLFVNFNLNLIFEKIYQGIKKAQTTLTVDQIKKLIGLNNDLVIDNQTISADIFIAKCCSIHPHIQERKINEYSTYLKNHSSTRIWISMMQNVLEKENTPLHFTEITYKVNEQYKNEKDIDVRRAHSLLIQSPIFAHVGVKGTYGLVNWGIRKESSVVLVEECIKKAGFPIHWTQILNYVGKYKSTSKANVRAILDNSGKFVHIGEGVYGIKNS